LMFHSEDSPPDAAEFTDDASYGWWRNSRPSGYVLAVTSRRPPLLHKARCRDVDPDRRPGRLFARGSRLICADAKTSLRAWVKRELPEEVQLLDRCEKCGP
jgi:hypothetical protein